MNSERLATVYLDYARQFTRHALQDRIQYGERFACWQAELKLAGDAYAEAADIIETILADESKA